MTKQVSRGAPFAEALREGGIDEVVAVDMAGASAAIEAGMSLGHLGHLVQVPRGQTAAAAAMRPKNWTVFNEENAAAAGQAAGDLGRVQDLLLRIAAPGDFFYDGHQGGFAAANVVAVADRLDRLPGARVAGVTTFPALLFDPSSESVAPTPNLATLAEAAAALAASGRERVRVNAPGTTSASVLGTLAEAGATQVEPGHGLTGTTPQHAVEDLAEEPAVLYLSEVSHQADEKAYFFGGGLYVDPVFPGYQPRALVAESEDPDSWLALAAEIPPPAAIDYYGRLLPPRDRSIGVGSTVVLGFRFQAFVTRAEVVGLRGVGTAAVAPTKPWGGDGRTIEIEDRGGNES
jgi:predicted amino acid racemase